MHPSATEKVSAERAAMGNDDKAGFMNASLQRLALEPDIFFVVRNEQDILCCTWANELGALDAQPESVWRELTEVQAGPIDAEVGKKRKVNVHADVAVDEVYLVFPRQQVAVLFFLVE